MPSLRAIRLLNAVEGGTHSGAQLEVSLADAGRLAEFKVLLGMRGQARRIAASPTSVATLILSPAAINAVFTMASAQNSTACQAIVAQPTAVASVALSLAALTAVEANEIAFGQFTASASYEQNSKNAIAVFAGVNPATFATIALLIANSTARTAITGSRTSMRALLASAPSVAVLAGDTTGMSQVANNPVAVRLVTSSALAMPLVANNTVAMAEITPVADAMSAIANSSLAMLAVYASGAAWASFKASPNFIATVPATTATLGGLNPALFPTLVSIIDNASALTKVSANGGASEAIATNAVAMSYLATHTNFALVSGNPTITNSIASSGSALVALATHANFALIAGNASIMAAFAANGAAVSALGAHANFGVAAANPVAIGALTGSQSAMTAYLGNNSTLATMFNSAGARGAMFASNIAINTIAATASAVAWLKANKKVETYSTTVPNGAGAVGAFTAFGGGVPAKILVLAVRQAGIAAIPTDYTLATGVAGSQAGVLFSTFGVAALAADQYPQAHIATYSNPTVKTAAAVIAITGVLGIQYVDMT